MGSRAKAFTAAAKDVAFSPCNRSFLGRISESVGHRLGMD